ncbi:hypothetical protein AN916_09685 [Mycobacteroides immunogenum]|nr:hypothetical protein AN915_12165 [Mycobacteroides immunogenum]KPG55335.1 hypothetical protein AN916_09685 [Mycobacteroides immunogenum]KPG61347.1 hypothetical protein AN918_06695 [Mycobacteroides immunogenum]
MNGGTVGQPRVRVQRCDVLGVFLVDGFGGHQRHGLVRMARELVGEHPAPEGPEPECHLQQVADDVRADEVGDVLDRQAHVRNAQLEDVTRYPERNHGDDHAHAAEREEQQRLVMPFPAAAVAEAPFPIKDVGGDDRDDAGDDLGGEGLGFQDRQLERVEDARVDDEGGGADNAELDQLVVPLGDRPDEPG